MNKFIQNLFLILFPFYPLWAWVCYSITKKNIDFVINILLISFALYFLINSNKKLPKYLLFFIIFTIYHLCSIYINNLAPPQNTNWLYFIFSDTNLFACTLLIIVENTYFNNRFITTMNRNIFIIVLISLIVSLIQIKNPLFFFNEDMDEGLVFFEEGRIPSIYSWGKQNSGGITFPILIAVLLSIYYTKKLSLFLIVFSGIIVSFLTRGRYVMISTLVALSQLFLINVKLLSKKVQWILFLTSSIIFTGFVAEKAGYNINEVIDNRILEKESGMASAKTRILSYEVFLKKFPENPWLGVGPETRDDVIKLLGGETPGIHIGYLSYLYYYGIIGSLFLFLTLYYLLKEAWLVGREYNFWGSFFGLASFCLANFTLVYFNLSEMGIIIAVIYLRHFSENPSVKYPDGL